MRLKPTTASTALLLASAAALAFAQSQPPPVLVFSKTAGYRHDSIPTAISALQDIADRTSLYDPTFSEDENLFTSDGLQKFKAIVFLSNSDQVLTSDGETAFAEWLTGGGSLVGLHAATACLFNDTAFGVAMGSWFNRHPTIQNATFTKLVEHETIDMLPDRYNTFEEVYSFRTDPRSVNATVLLTVDPDSYQDSDKPTPEGVDAPYYQGSPHPIAWYREGGMNVDLSNGTVPADQAQRMNGRMCMTSLGHTNETWQSQVHLDHVEAGLRWTLADLSSTNSSTSSSSSSSNGRSRTSSPSSSSSSSSQPSSTMATNSSPMNFRIASFSSLLLSTGLFLLFV
ncbi:hypothetical protein JCM3765_001285 [Sporobolomyces pararoseus]